jgi:dTDP-4-amino-4,6-dideoxygalactose transaminase
MVSTDEGDLHHLAVVRARDRDGLLASLKSAGIESKIHFATPLHLQAAPWADPSRRRPNAEAWCGSILTLPCFPGMTEAELKRVANAIERHFER